mgnify:CR=1 FL=1
MSVLIAIPARYASTRLPGKPLADLAGKPMIQNVWDRVSAVLPAVVANDDARIAEVVYSFGGRVRMTSPDCPNGTARVAEVLANWEGPRPEIVLNVQGDEPLIPPAIIDQVAANLAAHSEAGIATLAEPIEDVAALFNPNVVKVSCNLKGLALTFSRAPLPWARDAFALSRETLPAGVPYRRHIGIYAYRAGFLHDFVAWGPCQLEDTECLEQLRALWHGVAIHVADALQSPPAGVDTLEDLQRVRRLLGA